MDEIKVETVNATPLASVQEQLADALGLKYPRDLERRCRNAEKLLDECNLILAANGLYPITQKRVSAHLAAAAQEDGK